MRTLQIPQFDKLVMNKAGITISNRQMSLALLQGQRGRAGGGVGACRVYQSRCGQVSSVIKVRLADLIKDGDISQNIEMSPGDTLIIPQSWF